MGQELKKIKIVVASILKPANDVRMCSKLGKSLVDSGNFELHSIGAHIHANASHAITLYFLPACKRISWKRVLQPLRVFKLLWRIKPQLVIVATHELLWVGVLMKILTRCKLVYDVQENYYRNILFTNAFPKLLRYVLALYVRGKEIIVTPWVDHFVLAERCYQQELSFVKPKYITIENKVEAPVHKIYRHHNTDGNIKLLFTGTLAESTGVFYAINLAKKLHACNNAVRLKLVGYCSQPNTCDAINESIKECSFISLTGGYGLVSHEIILDAIEQADFGIIAYPANPSTANKIPTKLYEYIGYALPILLISHAPWVRMCEPYPACIAVDFNNPDVSSILEHMQNKNFYAVAPAHVYWHEECVPFINLIHKLLNQDLKLKMNN